MREKLPWILLASVGMVFLKASLIIAQQSTPPEPARKTIQESGPIYVVGNVISPRALYLKDPVTLTKAIAMSGGIVSKPKTNKLVIYRRGADGVWTQHMTMDIDEIRKHRSDPVLQPDDIVDVGGLGWLVPALLYPMFDSRPLITLTHRIIS